MSVRQLFDCDHAPVLYADRPKMILEEGNRSQFKQCVFENVCTVTCKLGHVTIIPEDGFPADSERMLAISNQNVCCIDAISGHWLDRVQDVMEKMPKSPALESLAYALKFARNVIP